MIYLGHFNINYAHVFVQDAFYRVTNLILNTLFFLQDECFLIYLLVPEAQLYLRARPRIPLHMAEKVGKIGFAVSVRETAGKRFRIPDL